MPLIVNKKRLSVAGLLIGSVAILMAAWPVFVSTSTSGKTVRTDGGQALKFDGVDDHLEFSPIALPEQFSLEAWVNAGPKSDQVIFGNNQGNAVLMLSGPNIRFGSAGLEYVEWPGAKLSRNEWHHLVVVRAGSMAELFIDGVSIGTRTLESKFDWAENSNNHLRFLGRNFAAAYFQGQLDEVRVYKRALSKSEITTHHNNGQGSSGTADSGLVAAWHFDEGRGTTAADYSGTGYVAMLRNGLAWTNGERALQVTTSSSSVY
jgi:hypothetical protein